ncbi:MAG: hypothetical protein E1N59_1293 [Puniceicoccaceae bacterium 5H]|nr:MAG: hypothetical protein E1N59_1293 [Puniceicoccaceae bacterium 5H]
MEHSRQRLAELINGFAQGEGLQATPIPGVYCTKVSAPDLDSRRRWRACLAIIAQGAKEIRLEDARHRLEETHYTASPIDLPVITSIPDASPARPFLALLIDFDPLALREMAASLESELRAPVAAPRQAVFVGETDAGLLQAAVRLAEFFTRPPDARALGPLVVKEAFYHLLRGPNGPALYQFVRAGTRTQQIYHAIYSLRTNLGGEVDIEALVRSARMSRSVFFAHFKQVTGFSPIQYLKRIRLLEARRLMVEEGTTAEEAAFRVGYRSAPQFSREYARMFAAAPRRDAAELIRQQRTLAS